RKTPRPMRKGTAVTMAERVPSQSRSEWYRAIVEADPRKSERLRRGMKDAARFDGPTDTDEDIDRALGLAP
ncbi:MAG: hypothetical protein LC808_36015, partial [Actinobacteria bacterium]|nr:hypothetical protein [Actinomycetota bacterium]